MCEIHPDVPLARPTNTKAGKWSTRRNGCRTAMPACVSTPAAPAARRATRPLVAARDARSRECVEWAGAQPWSNGKVGLNGISYYAINQWQVRGAQPKHLAAICAGRARPTSIATRRTMAASCDVLATARGAGRTRPARLRRAWLPQPRDRRRRAGPRRSRRRSSAEPPRFRRGCPRTARPDEYHADALAGLVEGEGAAALGRQLGRPWTASAGQHRGFRPRRVEAEVARGTRRQALDAFYTDYGVGLQKKFFGHFLKGEKTAGTSSRRCCRCAIRRQVRRAA